MPNPINTYHTVSCRFSPYPAPANNTCTAYSNSSNRASRRQLQLGNLSQVTAQANVIQREQHAAYVAALKSDDGSEG